jgi:hypothetical protein
MSCNKRPITKDKNKDQVSSGAPKGGEAGGRRTNQLGATARTLKEHSEASRPSMREQSDAAHMGIEEAVIDASGRPAHRAVGRQEGRRSNEVLQEVAKRTLLGK